jgi:hypothetical protein
MVLRQEVDDGVQPGALQLAALLCLHKRDIDK